MDPIEKIAEGFNDECAVLMKLAEIDGSLDFEKFAEIATLVDGLSHEDLQELDRIAMEKTAVFGFGRAAKAIAGVFAPSVGRMGQRMMGFAARHSPIERISRMFVHRGIPKEEALRRAAGLVQDPRKYLMYRRLAGEGVVPAREVARAARARMKMRGVTPPGGKPKVRAAAKGKGARPGKAPTKEEAAAAMTGWRGLWPQLKGGLMWGGGFGLAQRFLAPEAQPEYQFGE